MYWQLQMLPGYGWLIVPSAELLAELGKGSSQREQTLFSQPGTQVWTLLGRVDGAFHDAWVFT